MKRLLLFVFVAAAVVAPRMVVAQTMVAPTGDAPKDAPDAPENRLTIYAANQPDPLLRYRFWPDPSKRIDQNATALVSRAVILQLQVAPDTREAISTNFREWMEMPVDQLPKGEIRKLLQGYRSALNELDRAQNLMQTDYPLQLDQLSGAEMIQTLLPELQEMRTLGRVIALRARLAIAEERWDDMVRDCRIGFRLAEVASHSTEFLVGRLVGFAIGSMMMETVEIAIQRPNCPSMYWALVSLPGERLFETRQSIEYESVLLSRIFDHIGDLPNEPIGAPAAREKLRSIVDSGQEMIMEWGTDSPQSDQAKMLAGAYIVMMSDPSRDVLAETDDWGEQAYELSAPEAVLRATILTFARARDRWVAWSMLPDDLWSDYESEWSKSLKEDVDAGDPLGSLVNMLTPAVDAARKAGRRTEQLHHWLITVEALRLHAGETGELPESINRLEPVPAWNDPLADGPFGYQRSTPRRATLTRAPRYPNDSENSFQIELKRSK